MAHTVGYCHPTPALKDVFQSQTLSAVTKRKGDCWHPQPVQQMFTLAGQAEAASRTTAGAVERRPCLDCNHAVHVPASCTVSELLACVITAWRCTLFGPSLCAYAYLAAVTLTQLHSRCAHC